MIADLLCISYGTDSTSFNRNSFCGEIFLISFLFALIPDGYSTVTKYVVINQRVSSILKDKALGFFQFNLMKLYDTSLKTI